MKRAISVFLALTLALLGCVFLAGCAKNSGSEFEIVLLTDGSPVNDKAYSQSAWSGIEAYAKENNISCRYYQPIVNEEGKVDKDTVEKYIDVAVKSGAKTVVLTGETYAVSAYEIAPTYKDVSFILIDAYPHSADDDTPRVQSNVMSISFDKLQAGFLAGYTAVTEGQKDSKGNVKAAYNTKLGYFGSSLVQASYDFGAGFVQGAAYAADKIGVPITLDYAEYDSELLDFDYSINIEPVYIKTSEAKKDTFKVKVVDGIGSGVYTDGENVTITANPAPEGKTFDHWEVKSDTEGVKDKKVNISDKKAQSMNLLVGKCDCTITAVWSDCKTVPVSVAYSNLSSDIAEVINVPEDSEIWVEAPPALLDGMVFERWEDAGNDVIDNVYSKGISVKVGKEPLTLVPVYTEYDSPTFRVNVENGTGTGTYVAGDTVKLVADPPEEGYMFYKWENYDRDGNPTGIAMENEYCYHTQFEMTDRFASVVEKMIEGGDSVVFAGGNPKSDSVFKALESFDYSVYAFGSGIDEGSKGNCLASVVLDYGAAVKLALKNYKGGGFLNASCENNCLYVTGRSINEYQLDGNGEIKKDKKGNQLTDDAYNEQYAEVYKGLADGSIKPSALKAGDDVRSVNNSKCLTLNYWITE